MSRIEDAFNHAARIFHAAAGRLFIKVGDSFEELANFTVEPGTAFSHLSDAMRYAFPKSTFTCNLVYERWYHRAWQTIRRFLVWISNLD